MADMVLLKMQNICKSFPGVKVLDQVNLDLKEGEVHALLGENGAGKSTLIKILGGIYTADSGSIFLQGKEVKVNSVMDAQKNEIRIIHQEIVLVHVSYTHLDVYKRQPCWYPEATATSLPWQ